MSNNAFKSKSVNFLTFISLDRPTTTKYTVTASEEGGLHDDEDEDEIVEVHDVFEKKTETGKELFARVKWRSEGIQDEPFFLVKEDAPEAVGAFLLINKHLEAIVKMYEEKVESVAEAESTVKPGKKRRSVSISELVEDIKKSTKREKKTHHCCAVNHFDVSELRMCTIPTYFNLDHGRYFGVTCEKCSTVITTASPSKPVYCCPHEYTCTKSLVTSTESCKPRRVRNGNSR